MQGQYELDQSLLVSIVERFAGGLISIAPHLTAIRGRIKYKTLQMLNRAEYYILYYL